MVKVLFFISVLSELLFLCCQGQLPTDRVKNAAVDLQQDGKPRDQPSNAIPQDETNGKLSAQPHVDDSDIINLAEHPDCLDDVRRLCHEFPSKKDGDAKKEAKNSLDVLECFLNHDDKTVSSKCHQIMYDFKKNITTDKRIADIAVSQCADDLAKPLQECTKFREDPGHFISCLVEDKNKIEKPECQTFVNKVALVVFSDYRLVSFFVEACEEDLKWLQCAYLDNKNLAGHSQGAAISCLVKRLEVEQKNRIAATQGNDVEAKQFMEGRLVKPECSKQVLRLMELQADDYHLDRALFLACRDSREQFCHDVQSGQGRVYRCLLSHKEHPEMPKECKAEITQREKIAQTDYKVDYGLAHMCAKEITHFQCAPATGASQEVGLSYVILCLEGIVHQQGQEAIGPPCLQALHHQRQALMNDYNISPNIVVFCENDIKAYCSNNVHPTAIIHCLMGVAKERVPVATGQRTNVESKLSAPCNRELEQLLLAVDASRDVKVDTILYEACRTIIDHSCAQTQSSTHLMGCLMEHMHMKEMSDQCEKHLLESHYFVTRDIRFDAELYDACKVEATNNCHLKKDFDPNKKDLSPETGPLTFSCLYRHALELDSANTKPVMSEGCKAQVKRAMYDRAKAMDIPPEVDVNCIHDLAYFCTDRTFAKGQEFICLQKNYAKLQDQCKGAVQHFTQAIDKDMKLSTTYENCLPMMERFCKTTLTKDSTFDDAMECLIPHKEEVDQADKCVAEINHYQLVNIQEYQLNLRFKESCREDVEHHCSALGTKDIGEVVLCLSSILRQDTIDENKHRLSQACRKQLRSELLTRAKEPEMDPMIQENCASDIARLCPAGVREKDFNLLECLRSKPEQLSEPCHKKLFKIEQAQAVDEYADFTLIQACRRVIEKHCADVPGDKLLPCLVEAKNEKKDAMDIKCSRVVVTRQLEESKDVRLNPALYQGCKLDINKFCKKELDDISKKDKETEDIETRLISCLKEHKKRLTEPCHKQMRVVLKEVALNYKLDPNLAKVCADDANSCHEAADGQEGEGQVLECLKSRLKEHKLKNDKCKLAVASMIAEGKADIHVDPILFLACQVDLKTLCYEIDPGEGKQFHCLANAMNDGHKMSVDCKKKLKERIELIGFAAEIAPPETMEELAESVVESPARNYFLSVLGGALLAVLVIGICCGRASKRIRKELKNR